MTTCHIVTGVHVPLNGTWDVGIGNCISIWLLRTWTARVPQWVVTFDLHIGSEAPQTDVGLTTIRCRDE